LITRNLVVLVSMFVACLPVLGQHWQTPSPTGIDHSLVITEAMFDGNSLVEGDEIAVFTPTGVLAGHLIWTSETVQGMPVWGDDPLTEDLVEGFIVGELMDFKFWISEVEFEVCALFDIASGQEYFVPDGFTTLSLSATSNQVESSGAILPELLLKAWPTPFNSSVSFEVENSRMQGILKIYNSNGQLVRTISPESNQFTWDGKDNFGKTSASGVYFCEFMNVTQSIQLRVIKLD